MKVRRKDQLQLDLEDLVTPNMLEMTEVKKDLKSRPLSSLGVGASIIQSACTYMEFIL